MNDDRPNSGEAAFYRNPLSDHVLAGMGEHDLRSRRRARIDTPRAQRNAVKRGRSLARLTPEVMAEMAVKARKAGLGARELAAATREVSRSVARMLRGKR